MKKMPSGRGFFITGTDTGIGKTHVTCTLIAAARSVGKQVLAMKPVATGVNGDEQNEDVVRLLSSLQLDSGHFAHLDEKQKNRIRQSINAYTFSNPISPHLAAIEEKRDVSLVPIVEAYRKLQACAELIFVEGIGGFQVPLGPMLDSCDLAGALKLPIILVVGIRVGCINHALLTQEAIVARKLKFAGWIANCVDPAMSHVNANIQTLSDRLHTPLLGILPWNPTRRDDNPDDIQRLAGAIDLLSNPS